MFGGWRKCYDELSDVYSSANIIVVMRTRSVSQMGDGKRKGKRPLGG
jgi:hypothetical protein